MKGFFNLSDVQIVRGDEKAVVRRSAATRVGDCSSCGRFQKCITPKMEVMGKGGKKILLLAEFPGRSEDEQGEWFAGETGAQVWDWIGEAGFDLYDDFWVTGAIRCYADKKPTAAVLSACNKKLFETIEELKPSVIIPVGDLAMQALVQFRASGRISHRKVEFVHWTGRQIPDQELGVWIVPIYSPLDIIRSRDKVLLRQNIRQIKKAVDLVGKPFPRYGFLNKCHVITNTDEAIKIVQQARLSKSDVSFDYETTGRKPHRKGHRIVCASLAFNDESYAFMFSENSEFRDAWKKLLLSKKAFKIAHNKKYEVTWTNVILGYHPVVQYDTMLAAHSLRNNQLTGLKFQVYVHFGIMGYDDEIDPYLKTTKGEEEAYGANGFNSIDKAPKEKLLLYNAADSLLTLWLYKEQIKGLTKQQQKGLEFFISASDTLAKIENNGIKFNENAGRQAEKEIQEKLIVLENEIRTAPEMEEWDKATAFRPSASADLSYLLFSRLGYMPKEKTKTGRPKADKHALENIDSPIVKSVLEWRRWEKARTTYIINYMREAVDGVLHPFFNLHLATTFRSSCDSPNFQNIPKRQKDVMYMVRNLIIPYPGQRLIEFDYKAVEVCVSVCYHKDPNMIKYVTDPSSDMHRDTGCDLFLKSKETLTKAERQVAKNGFVFPEFYGSYWEQVARAVWEAISEETQTHLRDNGVNGLGKVVYDKSGKVIKCTGFYSHVRDIENNFWKNRFPVYAEWKKDIYARYQKNGYIDSLTGFRYYGPMSRKEATNYPIQGSAFHCLLWTLLHVVDAMEERKFESRVIGQIHDSCVASVAPAEEEQVDRLVWEWGVKNIREYWDWIIVPLALEKAVSKVDGTWAEMEEVGYLNF